MAYADYEFYTDTYGGKVIAADDFKRFSVLASQYVDTATMGRAKSVSGDTLEAVKMSVCNLAEIFQDEEYTNEVAFSDALSSEAVGGWSQSYVTKSVGTTEADLLSGRKRDALILWLGNTGLLAAKGYYAGRRCR